MLIETIHLLIKTNITKRSTRWKGISYDQRTSQNYEYFLIRKIHWFHEQKEVWNDKINIKTSFYRIVAT